jgi:hypothetical protein
MKKVSASQGVEQIIYFIDLLKYLASIENWMPYHLNRRRWLITIMKGYA